MLFSTTRQALIFLAAIFKLCHITPSQILEASQSTIHRTCMHFHKGRGNRVLYYILFIIYVGKVSLHYYLNFPILSQIFPTKVLPFRLVSKLTWRLRHFKLTRASIPCSLVILFFPINKLVMLVKVEMPSITWNRKLTILRERTNQSVNSE